MTMAIDAYMVRDRETEAASGAYFPVRMVVVRDGIYVTDPLSGQWVLQPAELAIIEFERLNDVVATLILSIANPHLAGEETINGMQTYKVTGRIPASAVGWLPIDVGNTGHADIAIWVGRDERLPVQVHLTGAVGEYDDPGTMRELSLRDFNERVRIEPPADYIDLR